MSQTANIIIYGPGLIGQALVDVLTNAIERYRSPLKIIGIVDSQAGIIKENGFLPGTLQTLLAQKRNGLSIASMEGSISHEKVYSFFSPNTILVDTSNADDLAKTLLHGLRKGCSVTMSNKKNLVGPWPMTDDFFTSPHVRFESAVCAGTPVVANLRNLVKSLDEVITIEGCVSGTLNYICSQLDTGVSMAKAVEDAHDFGYTEPDPRDDLNGMDVARKALILARIAGWPLEMYDISVEKLYPESLSNLTKEDFFAKLFMMTPRYQQLAHHAAAEGMSLRYLAAINAKGGRCYMKAVPRESEFGLLTGPANKVSIHSRIHNPIPLTISGAGAGAEVTALGLLSDILDLSKAMT
ncbi:MAG: hypothetical protein V2J07_10020 [Anaerolineae bacterium]|jgi:homoserine dehydrogenase|nr:hypothetical protein [Anaerolineae bacterium]